MLDDDPSAATASGANLESAPTISPAAAPLPRMPVRTAHHATLIIAAFLVSAALATYSLVVTSGDGASAASGLVTHFAVLLFAASLIARPLARLFPTEFFVATAREAESLRLAFLVAFAFSLACLMAPAGLSGQHLSWNAALYMDFNGLVLMALALATWREMVGSAAQREWRAIRAIATSYFWLAFVLSDLAQLSSGARASSWHQFSLTLLLSSAGVGVAARALAAHADKR